MVNNPLLLNCEKKCKMMSWKMEMALNTIARNSNIILLVTGDKLIFLQNYKISYMFCASKRNSDLFLFCPSCPSLFSNKNDYKVIPDGYSSLPLPSMEPESDKIRNMYLSIRTKQTKQALQLALV